MTRQLILTVLFFILFILSQNVNAYSFSIGDRWNEKTIGQMYEVNKNKVVTEAIEVANASPLSIIPFLGGSTFYSVKNEPLVEIAKVCNREKEDWGKISCASSKLHDYIIERDAAGEKVDCKTFAFSFKDLAAKLDIPGLFVQTEQFMGKFQKNGSLAPHVFNKILVPSSDGQVYAYILDVGWAPDKLFPKTELTENRHKTVKDFNSLPAFKNRPGCNTKSVFDPVLNILKYL